MARVTVTQTRVIRDKKNPKSPKRRGGHQPTNKRPARGKGRK